MMQHRRQRASEQPLEATFSFASYQTIAFHKITVIVLQCRKDITRSSLGQEALWSFHQAELCPRCLRQTVPWDNLVLSSSIHQFTFLPYLTKQRAQGIGLSSILKIQRLIQKANVFSHTWIKTISDFSFVSTKVYHKTQICPWEMAHTAFLPHEILVAAYNHLTVVLQINIGGWK